MKCNPIRWLWGLVPLLALGGLMQLSGGFTRIESELQRQSEQALAAADQGWGQVAFSGRDATLTGQAVDNSDQLRAAGIVRSVTGVRVVDDQSKLLEEENNYVWGAQLLADGKLRLSGFVPNQAARAAVLGAVKSTFPGRAVEDRMKFARGAPAQSVWEGGINYGLKQLASLKSGGRVDLDGNNFLIEGEAADLNAYKGVKTALQSSLPQGVRLRSDKVTPPVVQPYTWSAKYAANQVLLSGYVPNERARDEIFGAAKKSFPKAAVLDRMQIAAGEPKDWLPGVIASLTKLSRTEDGMVDFRDAQMTISGLVADATVAEDVRRALKSDMPASIRTTDALRIKEVPLKVVDPFTTGVVAANGVVTLSGYVPSPAAKVTFVDAAKLRMPGQRIEDKLEVAAGAPDGWQTCALAGMQGLGRVGAGRMQLTGRALSLTGQTDNEALSRSIGGDVGNAAGSSCASDVKIAFTGIPAEELKRRAEQAAAEEAARKAAAVVPPAPAPVAPVAPPQPSQARAEAANCQALLTKVRNEGVINFKRASSDIDAQSNATLDRIVSVMGTCKAAKIEIQGHTDAEGTTERNINLSTRRANAVMTYLTAAGVEPARLTAVGFGEQRPVVPNDTKENMARNRRIEFEVKAE